MSANRHAPGSYLEQRFKHNASLAVRAFFATLSVAFGLVAAEPQTPTLKVSGTAEFSSETRVTGETYEVRAVLLDEVGQPIANAEAIARVTSNDSPPTLRRCGDARSEKGGSIGVVTDAAGRACVLVNGMRSGTLELSFEDPRGYYARASRRVALPESAADVYELGFDPPLSTLSLDKPLQTIGVVAKARPGGDLPDAAELVLSLADGRTERELSRVALDGVGEVHRLAIVSASFGQPGPARLIAKLLSRSGQERAITSNAVLRTVTAMVDVANAAEGVEAGAAVRISVASALGPVASGVVEARSLGRSVAAAPVQGGAATLILPSAPGTLLGNVVSFEYVGDGQGWQSGTPVDVRVRPPTPNYGRSALWIAAGVLAALAVVLGWRRPARLGPTNEAPPPRARASVELVEAFGPMGGYRGTVRDAHEGTPISPAVISFVAPGAQGRVLLQLRATHEGEFSTDSTFPADTLIEITAPLHATLTAPLPAPGRLELSLISRRRALLERVVRWAERHGKPWVKQSGEPTPGNLAAIAMAESETEVENWARAVEQLAYGASAPDAAREQAAGVMADPKTARERGID